MPKLQMLFHSSHLKGEASLGVHRNPFFLFVSNIYLLVAEHTSHASSELIKDQKFLMYVV